MLIDAYAEDLFTDLHDRARALGTGLRLHLLLDGAFVPRLHRKLPNHSKTLLFELLPGCSEQAKDVSPFLVPFESTDEALSAVLKRCSGWPMVSVIETTDRIEQLAERLAAWCVVEADGQRFNFRFPDTRRLPAIFGILNGRQRAQLAGPATRWSYVSRDGHWRELELSGSEAGIVAEPVLDQAQFAQMVDDSRADELLVLLSDRGNEVYRHPSRSYQLVATAIKAAKAELGNDELIDWCQWCWRHDRLGDDPDAAAMFNAWIAEAREWSKK
jgi:hypothetical protein